MDGNSEAVKIRSGYPAITTEISLFFFGLALHSSFPASKNLLLTKVCLQQFNNSLEYCYNTSNKDIGKNDYVQNNTATWDLYGSIAYYIPACIIAIYAGSWGDKFGRKFPLFIPPVGYAISLIISGFFDLYIREMSLWVTILASFINGIGGGELIVISASASYIVEISEPEYRIRRLSIIQAMVTIGATVGPLIGLALRDHFGNYAVFFFAAGMCLISLLYSVFCLKKLDPEDKLPFNFKNLFKLDHMRDALNVCIRPRAGLNRRFLLTMLTVIVAYFFTSNGARTLVYLFVKDEPLSWSFQDYTLLFSITASIGGALMLIVFPVVRNYISFRDTTVAIVSALADIVYYTMLGFATTTELVYTASSFLILSWFQPISCRTIVSKLVDTNEEGKVFSIIAVAENIGFLISSAAFNGLWPVTRKIFRGMLFEACGALTLIYVCGLIYIHIHQRIQQKSDGYRRLPS